MQRPLLCSRNKNNSKEASEAGHSGQEEQLEETYQRDPEVRRCWRRVPGREKLMPGHVDYYKGFGFYSVSNRKLLHSSG